MAARLDNLGWFYRGKLEQQFGGPEPLNQKMFYLLIALSTIVGFSVITWQISQFLRLLSSIFFLPGKSVSSCSNIPIAPAFKN